MEPDHIASWSQFVLYCSGAFALITGGVGHLFTKMTSGYGGIIKALQDQVNDLQGQVTKGKDEAAQLKIDNAKCWEQHMKQSEQITNLESGRLANQHDIEELRKQLIAVRLAEATAINRKDDQKAVEVLRQELSQQTQAMQDISIKVDQLAPKEVKS
jgi:hypothetical protein